jgi:hypothetical protein
MIEWKFNMDEAPRDGKPFLAWNTSLSTPDVLRWDGSRAVFDGWYYGYSSEQMSLHFTAWAHINPPEVK